MSPDCLPPEYRPRDHRVPCRPAARAARRFAWIQVLALFPSLGHAQLLQGVPSERCEAVPPGAPAAAEWLHRAAAMVLPATIDGRILRYNATTDVPMWEQSDRMYEPFIPNASTDQYWYDPASGNIGRQRATQPWSVGKRAAELFTTTGAVYRARDTTIMQVPAAFLGDQMPLPLNPWTVLREWQARAAEVRVAQRCVYRDFPRIVLALGDDRLYLTESDATPIKLDRTVPHYLWGQVRVAYLWNTWWEVTGGGRYPLATFAMYEGIVYHRQSAEMGSVTLAPRDSAPNLATPVSASMMPVPDLANPDTIRVSSNTWLLRTRMYTHAVTLQRDTIFLMDATTSEARSRGDSAWIAKLFPGRHPMVLVVTDLAWPHISGVRYWVARGATVVSHRMSADFLRRVVDRHWTLTPDLLERERSRARFRLTKVGDSLKLAGGAVIVHSMLGFSTEGAVAVWVAPDRFLWAGDYVQPTPVSPYAKDVVRTVRALGLVPENVGAQHAPLTPWKTMLQRYGDSAM